MRKLRNFILNPRKDSSLSKEAGNAFLMYMLLMPVLVFTMGFGMQVAINQYVKTTLQSALDQATQSGVSLAQNGGIANRNVSLSAGIMDQVRKVYDTNRAEKVGSLICRNTLPKGGTTIITPTSGCVWGENSWTIYYKNGQPYLKVDITDYSTNLFGAVFGSSTQEYHIISEARITRSSR